MKELRAVGQTLRPVAGKPRERLNQLASRLKEAYGKPESPFLDDYSCSVIGPKNLNKVSTSELRHEVFGDYYMRLMVDMVGDGGDVSVISRGEKALLDFKKAATKISSSNSDKKRVAQHLNEIGDYFKKGNFGKIAYLKAQGAEFEHHILAGGRALICTDNLAPAGRMIAVAVGFTTD